MLKGEKANLPVQTPMSLRSQDREGARSRNLGPSLWLADEVIE
jgi:hypothetical protein